MFIIYVFLHQISVTHHMFIDALYVTLQNVAMTFVFYILRKIFYKFSHIIKRRKTYTFKKRNRKTEQFYINDKCVSNNVIYQHYIVC